jgi:putative heme iron utilization protein
VAETDERDGTAAIDAARQLWEGAFHGVLGTQSESHPGYPFPSLVPYCLDRHGNALLLLSHLAQHARNLSRDPRCSLLLTGPETEDAQQRARLAVLGECRPLLEADNDEGQRYFRYYPHALPYLEELNFRLFRLVPSAAHINTGFASARWLGVQRMAGGTRFGADEERRLIRAISEQPFLGRLMRQATGTAPPEAAAVAVAGADAGGVDLRTGRRIARVTLSRQIGAPTDLLEVLRNADSAV